MKPGSFEHLFLHLSTLSMRLEIKKETMVVPSLMTATT